MSLTTGLVLTLVLLAGNGFFVAAEFALVAAKRPKLEQAAERGSRAAAQAVAGIRELSLMLAGAQLGITICSLGLGVVSEPVIASVLTPLFHDVGLSDALAHAVSFVIALALVTFLHMVVGEMAPKSWAIARPERSALLLALPFRGFAWLFRPLLTALNHLTNGLLRLIGVEPREEMEVSRTPEQLRHLVEESRRLGLIEEADRNLLSRALDAPRTGLGDLVIPLGRAVSVPSSALPQEVIDVSTRTGVTRLLLCGDDGEVTGVVHAREAYLARAEGAAPAAETMAHPIPVVRHDIAVADAVTDLRLHRSQLALVRGEDGTITGVISLDDLLTRLLAPV
ncbi:hemolysin family protein [Actinocorallia sp. A-T 12471]|uniref:hemolysin family protein n=1 Tax=Actinocorallia sp. A-T 12471 TaxID=3089813 RepID=UPI0029D313B1|nr:hemolysin family protein [Actinocorallia sp. A-T 12471]MDX6738333.1 hemolysin family protein [Actinocorallia sp. A-T 12471]